MPRALPTPTSFDGWLGSVIDGEAKPRGGRSMLATITKNSIKTIDRRIRGEASFLVSEVTIIARYLDTTAEALVQRALESYGEGDAGIGYAKLLSEGSLTNDDLTTRRLQKEAEKMSPAEIEAIAIAAAAEDAERSEDAPPAP